MLLCEIKCDSMPSIVLGWCKIQPSLLRCLIYSVRFLNSWILSGSTGLQSPKLYMAPWGLMTTSLSCTGLGCLSSLKTQCLGYKLPRLQLFLLTPALGALNFVEFSKRPISPSMSKYQTCLFSLDLWALPLFKDFPSRACLNLFPPFLLQIYIRY